MPKKSPKRNVAVIFNLPVEIRAALQKKVPAGKRSQFVVGLLSEKLKVVVAKKVLAQKVTPKKTVKKAVKKVVPQKKMPTKKKSVFRRIFKK